MEAMDDVFVALRTLAWSLVLRAEFPVQRNSTLKTFLLIYSSHDLNDVSNNIEII